MLPSLGLLDVRRVAAARAADDRALPGLGDDHELVRGRAADRPGIRLDRRVVELAGLEDLAVGAAHVLVGRVQALGAGVEGVGVLHDELAPAHEAEAGTDLVPELGLDLVEAHRQLPVALDVPAHDVRDHLLVGGAEDEVALVPVLDPQELLAVALPALGLLPQLGRLDRRHLELGRADGVELPADDRHQLGEAPPAEGQVAVDAGRDLLDQAGPHHQLVRDDLRVVRHLAGGIEIETAPAHGTSGTLSGWKGGYFFWLRCTRSRRRELSFMNSIIFSSSPSPRAVSRRA